MNKSRLTPTVPGLSAAVASVLSTNLGTKMPNPTGRGATGINKQSVGSLDVFAPAPGYGNGSGVIGDFVGDTKHHGGADKAVYAFAREELDYWSERLGRPLGNGQFGENLTTSGIVWAQVLVNQRLAVGSAVLEVSVPRQPCRTFADWLGQKGWVKTFTERQDAGAYLRVIEPGTITAGDTITFLPAPDHEVTMGQAFAAAMGDRAAMQAVVETGYYPPFYHDRLLAKLGR